MPAANKSVFTEEDGGWTLNKNGIFCFPPLLGGVYVYKTIAEPDGAGCRPSDWQARFSEPFCLGERWPQKGRGSREVVDGHLLKIRGRPSSIRG